MQESFSNSQYPEHQVSVPVEQSSKSLNIRTILVIQNDKSDIAGVLLLYLVRLNLTLSCAHIVIYSCLCGKLLDVDSAVVSHADMHPLKQNIGNWDTENS